jgi:peptidyl-prolyl cis-trans isomerase SurA
MTPDQFSQILRQNGILPETLRDQAKAQLAWRKVIEARIRPQIVVGDEQVDAEVDRLKSQEGQQQYRVAELFLSVDNPTDDSRILENMNRLVEEIKKGAPFQALAKQFSQASSASVGGDLGWVTLDQLDPSVAKAVQGLQKGGLAGPIRGIAGYYIVGLIDQRTFQLGEPLIDTSAIAVPLPPGSSEEEIQRRYQQLNAIRDKVDGCSNIQQLAREASTDALARNAGKQNPDSLPPDVAKAIANVPTGKASEPIRRADALLIAVVCGRTGSGIDRDGIKERLIQEQIELRARRYLRDLRRTADLDIRI